MRQFFIIIIAILFCISCKTTPVQPESKSVKDSFLLLVPDTTNNRRAQGDLNDLKYRTKLEHLIGLKDLTKGADSFEIRLWYDFSMGNSQELYILRFQDSVCNLSYHRIYPKPVNYDDENRNREWNPYTDPIIDSSVSKTVLLTAKDYKNLHLDSIWMLKSQSELKISDTIGFTDGDSYIIEIADKTRFKYFRYHCAFSYYKKTNLTAILIFAGFCSRITSLAAKHHAIIPYTYN